MSLNLDNLIPKKKYEAIHYWNMLRNLLPKGIIWDPRQVNKPFQWRDNPLNGGFTHTDNVGTGIEYRDTVSGSGSAVNDAFANLLMAFAEELNRLDTRMVDFEKETIPGLSEEMLPDWEEMAGLPDECTPLAPTIPERQARVHTHITQNKGDPALVEFNRNQTFFIQYASALGYTITITEPLESEVFRVGRNRVGDRVGSTDHAFTWKVEGDWDATLQCIFEKIKPAHTILWWI